MIRASRELRASYVFAARPRGGRNQLARRKILSRLILERVHKYSYDIFRRGYCVRRGWHLAFNVRSARKALKTKLEEGGRAISSSSREDESIFPFGQISIRSAKLALNTQRKCICVCTENVPSHALQCARARATQRA